MTRTETGTHRDALDAVFPLSAPRARVCNGYTELASLRVPRVPQCELAHDWNAPGRPQRVRGSNVRGLSPLWRGDTRPLINRNIESIPDHTKGGGLDPDHEQGLRVVGSETPAPAKLALGVSAPPLIPPSLKAGMRWMDKLSFLQNSFEPEVNMNSELNSETVKLLREYRSVAAMAEHNGVPVQDRVHASARIFGDHLSMVEPALAAAWLRREAKRVEALANMSETEQ